MKRGLYESLITSDLANRLELLDTDAHEIREVDTAEQPQVLARHLQAVAERVLIATKDPAARVILVNELIGRLQAADVELQAPARQLLSVTDPTSFGGHSTLRPRIPLSDTALLTNAHGEPSLGSELRAELATSDTVDLLCAFVKWHGIRLLEDQLTEVRGRGVPFRVVTTTYMGATERAALEWSPAEWCTTGLSERVPPT